MVLGRNVHNWQVRSDLYFANRFTKTDHTVQLKIAVSMYFNTHVYIIRFK
jgi:hypothetical protein